MKKPFNPDAACYVLSLYHRQAETVEVGAIGQITWPAGWTHYAGRAAHGWASRMKRFQRPSRSPHWHVDYLVQSPVCEIRGVLPVDEPPAYECEISQWLGQRKGNAPLEPGLGASDCEEGCPAHAWVSDRSPADLVQLMDNTGEFSVGGHVALNEKRSRWIPLSVG